MISTRGSSPHGFKHLKQSHLISLRWFPSYRCVSLSALPSPLPPSAFTSPSSPFPPPFSPVPHPSPSSLSHTSVIATQVVFITSGNVSVPMYLFNRTPVFLTFDIFLVSFCSVSFAITIDVVPHSALEAHLGVFRPVSSHHHLILPS